MARWTRLKPVLLTALALGAGVATAGAFSGVTPGMWEISGVPGSKAPVKACFPSLDTLAQFEHRTKTCAHKVLSDAGTTTVVQYSCGANEFGRSELTEITPRSLRIETQGISGGLPFKYLLQARRVGDCAAH